MPRRFVTAGLQQEPHPPAEDATPPGRSISRAGTQRTDNDRVAGGWAEFVVSSTRGVHVVSPDRRGATVAEDLCE